MIKAVLKSDKFKGLLGKWVGKAFIVVIVAAVILGSLVGFKVIKLNPKASAEIEKRTANVMRGSLALSISGSGTASSANRADITPYVDGKITKVYFKEGDSVKEGDLLFEVDDSDVRLSMEKIKNSLAQNELSFKQTLNNISNLNVTAPFSGKITGLSLKKGDVVSKNATLMTLTDKSKMLLSLTFNSGADDIKPGKTVTVYIQSHAQAIEGKVTKVNGGSSGSQEINVEIEINNPGLLEEGMEASAVVNTSQGEVWSSESGKIEYINAQVIKSETGGTVKAVYVSENQYVKGGSLLVELEDGSLEISVQNNDIKIQELKTELELAKEKVENCKVVAPIEGVIVKQSVEAGDVAKSGQVLCTVANNNTMQMQISIDELDIAKIKTGMEARVTVDALSETLRSPLHAMVTNIAIEGTSSGGVTTYPVTITIDNPGNMKGGMNANAQIILTSKENTLLLPLEAVQTMGGSSFVMVSSDSTAAKGQNIMPGADRMPGRNRNVDGNGANDQTGNRSTENSSTGENQAPQRNRQGGNNTGDWPQQGNTENNNPNNNPNNSNNNNPNNNPNNSNNNNPNNRSDTNNPNNANMSGRFVPNQSGSGTNRMGSSGRVGSFGNAASAYYKDSVMVPVEVGINNETYIEIVSGLNEGDQVLLPPIVANQQTTQQNRNQMPGGGMMPMGGMGGMGGTGGSFPSRPGGSGGQGGTGGRTR
ncbi:MAG: HlyD family efflux transporter periplasmic adaptor subunit [Clostridiaceae bacterium]|nr:HlyD family efflux transporter periplasmic adaptor subunit [Clostridiaceae bacterium]